MSHKNAPQVYNIIYYFVLLNYFVACNMFLSNVLLSVVVSVIGEVKIIDV